MNLPLIASRTLQNFKAHPQLGALFEKTKKHLSRLFNSTARVRYSNQLIDQQISLLMTDPIVAKYVSCKKSCSACCHSQVSINADEAEFLALKISRGEVTIDEERLHLQAANSEDTKLWYQIPYKERACVFLDSHGDCSIYKDRPGVCRTNYAVTPAELCSTEDGIEKTHRLLNTHAADMVVAASFMASKQGGSMPQMLKNALDKIKNKRSRSRSTLQA